MTEWRNVVFSNFYHKCQSVQSFIIDAFFHFSSMISNINHYNMVLDKDTGTDLMVCQAQIKILKYSFLL